MAIHNGCHTVTCMDIHTVMLERKTFHVILKTAVGQLFSKYMGVSNKQLHGEERGRIAKERDRKA